MSLIARLVLFQSNKDLENKKIKNFSVLHLTICTTNTPIIAISSRDIIVSTSRPLTTHICITVKEKERERERERERYREIQRERKKDYLFEIK